MTQGRYHDALIVLAYRKLEARETLLGPVAHQDSWIANVLKTLSEQYAGSLSSMPEGLSIAEQVDFLEPAKPVASYMHIPGPFKGCGTCDNGFIWTNDSTVTRCECLKTKHEARKGVISTGR